MRGREECAVVSRRRELERDQPVPIQLDVAQGAPRQSRQAEPLAGEEGGADVEELVAGRELELLGREVRSLGTLVRRSQSRLGVQGSESGRLTLELPTDAVRVTSWKSRTAAAIETRPKTRTTARKRAGRRNRSDPNMCSRVAR